MTVEDPYPGDEQEIALCDLAASSPFDDDADLKVHVPSLRLGVDEETLEITDARVLWYRYDPAIGNYAELESTAVFSDVVAEASMTLDDFSGTNSTGPDRITSGFDLLSGGFDDVDGRWYLPELGSEDVYQAEWLNIPYRIDSHYLVSSTRLAARQAGASQERLYAGSVTNLGDFHKPDPGVHI